MTEKCNNGKPWSLPEDELLRAAVADYGENDSWKLVAERVPGRTNKACRKVRTSPGWHSHSASERAAGIALASLTVAEHHQKALVTE